MDPRLQLRVQRYGWDRAAELYDRAWSRQLEPAQALLLELAELREGEEVVETACGSGLVTVRIAHAVGPSGRVVATDLSEGMLNEAGRLVERNGVENVSFFREDAGRLDLPDEAFDASICCLGLMYVPEPKKALSEMRRVLRPGGRAVSAVWGERSRCGWAEIFPIVDSRVESEVCPLFFQLGAADTLRREMEEVGFSDVDTRRITTTLEYASPEEAVVAAFAGGPVAMAYSRFDDQVRSEAHQEYLESIADYRDGDGYRIPGEFVVTRGERTG